MKDKIFITIFALITMVGHNLCMKQQSNDQKYKNRKDWLEKSIVKNDTNSYSSIKPELQYEMLQLYIEENNLI